MSDTLALEIEQWQEKTAWMMWFEFKEGIIGNSIMFVTCAIVLYIIVFKRKRKEVFIILTPIFVMLANLFSIIGMLMIFKNPG